MDEAQSPVSELTLPQRIWGTFVAPRIVFQHLARRPRILGVLVVLVVVQLAASFLVSDIAFEAQQRRLEARNDLSAEQLAQAEKAMGFMRTFSHVLAAAAPVVSVYVLAGILLLITNGVLKGSTTYRHLAAAVAHVGLVIIPTSIVKVPLILAKRDIDVQTSLAAFLPGTGDDKGFLYHLLSQFDVFTLWQLGLTVLAVSVLARVTVNRAAYGIVGAWVVWIVVWVPLASLIPG